MSGFLNPYQVTAFKQVHAMHRDNQKKSDGIKFMLFLNKAFSYEEIAEILLVDDTTVRRWHKIFSANGIKTVLKGIYSRGTGRLSTDELSGLRWHLDQKIYLTGKEICAYVEKKYGVAYTPKGMTCLLHTLGFTYKKPKHVPGKVNRQAQEEFRGLLLFKPMTHLKLYP
ncbi:MAG: hypothetical protein GY760_28990 [Deltaproteobacteria bacterium]|nr:hypothetical protein [Deltaproteobacteria bacterium]